MPKLFDQMKVDLGKLSKAELSEIKSICNSLGAVVTPATKAGAGRPASMSTQNGHMEWDEDFILFYSVLSEVLGYLGVKMANHPSSMPEIRMVELQQGWSSVEDFITLSFEGRLRKPQRMKFYRVAIQIVIDYLEEREVPVTIKTISQQLLNSAGLINRQFPGYNSSGLMSVILQWGDFNAMPDEEPL